MDREAQRSRQRSASYRWKQRNIESVRAKARESYRRRFAEDPETYRAKRRARYGSVAREAYLAAARKRHEQPETWKIQILRRARARAKAKGLPFSLTPADLRIPERCPVLGVPIKLIDELDRMLYAGPTPHAPSIDRLDNTKGYVPGNIRIISFRANSLKSDAKTEEIRALLVWMEKVGAP